MPDPTAAPVVPTVRAPTWARALPFLVVALACAAASGCSGGDGGSVDASPVTVASRETACTAVAEAMCDRLAACKGHLAPYPDASTCRARAALGCPALLSLPGAVPPDRLRACADRLKRATCEELHWAERWEEGTHLELSFESAIRLCALEGGRADGAPCGSALQCEGGVCLRAEYHTDECGRCARLRGRGEPCDGQVCGQSLYCRWKCAGGQCAAAAATCEPLGGLDEPCAADQLANPSSSVGCRMGLYCAASESAGSSTPRGRCRARAKEGDPCDEQLRAGPFCENHAGVFCWKGRCTRGGWMEEPRKATFQADGETCSTLPELYSTRPCLYPARCDYETHVCRTRKLCAR